MPLLSSTQQSCCADAPDPAPPTTRLLTAWTFSQAHDTLQNPIKKKLYDAYVTDVNVEVPDGMSYAEWEAEQASPIAGPRANAAAVLLWKEGYCVYGPRSAAART